MKAEEIKFKGIRVDNGEWAYGMPLASRFGCSCMITKQGQLRADFIYSRHTIMDIEDVIAVDTETICQFTTLKDKNDVEIYMDDKFQYHKHEGFILPDFTGEILFRNGCFGYVATSENMGEAFHSFSEFDELQADFLDHIEIIGNIHDKYKQKQALIDMMRGDEELGLYD